jgi:hypothetical protein
MNEVDVLHKVMLLDPNYFFGTTEVCWIYTGKSGEAPDAIGCDRAGGVYFGEIKWKEGWAKSLPKQLERYVGLASGDVSNRDLYLKVAAAQTGAEALRDEWLRLRVKLQEEKRWTSVRIALGFLQLGWTPAEEHYLRAEWKKLENL